MGRNNNVYGVEYIITAGESVYLEDKKELDMPAPSMMTPEKLFVPLKILGNITNVEKDNIVWDSAENTVTIFKGNRIVQSTIGSNIMLVNGVPLTMEVAPYIKNNNLYLPIQYIADGLGINYQWDVATQTITLQHEEEVITGSHGVEYIITAGAEDYSEDGREIKIASGDTAEFIAEKLFVPLKILGNITNVEKDNIVWDSAENTVTIFKGNRIVQSTIGSNIMLVNGVPLTMEVAPYIKNNNLYLPIQYIADGLGINYQWDVATQTITLLHEEEVITGSQGIEYIITAGASVYLEDKKELDMPAPSMMTPEKLFVPLKILGNITNVEKDNIVWDSAENTVTIFKGNRIVQSTIGSNIMLVNGVPLTMEVVPYIKNNNLYLPIQYIADGLGINYQWDVATQTITLLHAEEAITEVTIGETITRNGLNITIERLEYNENDFIPNDPDSTNIYPKGFGVYYKIENNSEKVYTQPRIEFKLEPSDYEEELNRIGYNNHPVKDFSEFIYQNETFTGFYQYSFGREINIKNLEVFIAETSNYLQEAFGRWIVK